MSATAQVARRVAKEIKKVVVREDETVTSGSDQLESCVQAWPHRRGSPLVAGRAIFCGWLRKFDRLCRTTYNEVVADWKDAVVPWIKSSRSAATAAVIGPTLRRPRHRTWPAGPAPSLFDATFRLAHGMVPTLRWNLVFTSADATTCALSVFITGAAGAAQQPVQLVAPLGN